MTPENKAESKLKWEKPEIKVIELAAGEVLALGCKHDTGGLAWGNQPACGLGVPCSVPGS